jgi:DNA-binding GntR family transcriptional regulator
MNIENMDRIEPRTLKENVTEILRQSIIDGTLPPGTEFNQAQIAERLGVSRGPIREALGQLEQEGLIESTPYKGVVVTQLTRRYVEEIYSVRTSLETLAIERAIQRMGQADFDQLDAIINEMRAAARRGDLEHLVELDLAFHEFILRTADHQLALRLWKLVEVGVRRCLRIRHEIYTFLDEVVGSHPTMVTALRQRNRDWAVRILHEHIAESSAHILANLPPEEESSTEAPAPQAEANPTGD